MNTFSVWIMAIRPKTLIASITPVCMSAALALNQTPFPLLVFFTILSTALGIQILTNLTNDYFDYVKGADTQNRKGPTRVTHAGLVSTTKMKQALFLTTTLTLACGSILVVRGGFLFALLLALAIVIAFFYTAGPLPLAYLGLGDLFVFVFFGPVAIWTSYFLLTKEWLLTPFLVGLAPGALSTTLLTINNLRDVEEDITSGKKTLIVRFGTSFGKGEAIACLLLALSLPFLFLEEHPNSWLITLGMTLSTFRLAKRIIENSDPLVYNQLLAKTAQLLFLYTALFCLFWNL